MTIWNSIINLVTPDGSTLLLQMKSITFNMHLCMIAGGYTVAGSSDSATAGMDGVNRVGLVWDVSKWVNNIAGQPHTWIVYYHTGHGHSVCFDLRRTETYHGPAITIGKASFTGGSTTARPTSTDEFTLQGSIDDTILDYNQGAMNYRTHAAFSDGGDIWIWNVMKSAGVVTAHSSFCVGVLEDVAVGGDPYPVIGYFRGDTAGLRNSDLFSYTKWAGRTGSGVLCMHNQDPYMVMVPPSYSPAFGEYLELKCPTSGGQWTGRNPAPRLRCWIRDGYSYRDTYAPNYTDSKGSLRGFRYCQSNLGNGTLSTDNERAFQAIWMPGMLNNNPTYGA